ncbi:MAG: ribonuclease E inhibitor RraB [Luteibacter sp.]
MIEKSQLVEMFQQIADNTDWDLSQPLAWGYYFTDTKAAPLEAVVPLLEKEGYQFIDVTLHDDEESGEEPMYWLHVEKVEVHTPDTLDARNQQFYAFAAAHGVGAYDGMDVGPVEPEED